MSRPWAMATAAVPAAIPSRRFNSLVGWAGSWATVSMPLSVRRAAATGPMPGSGDAATAHLPGVVRRIRGRAGWPNRRSLPQRRTARLVRVTRQTFLCVRLVLPGRGVYDEDLAASAMPRVEAWPPCRNIAGRMSLLLPWRAARVNRAPAAAAAFNAPPSGYDGYRSQLAEDCGGSAR